MNISSASSGINSFSQLQGAGQKPEAKQAKQSSQVKEAKQVEQSAAVKAAANLKAEDSTRLAIDPKRDAAAVKPIKNAQGETLGRVINETA